MRRQTQQRRTTKHRILPLAVQPTREQYSVSLNFALEPRDILSRPIACQHQAPLRKLRRLDQRLKSIDQNIQPLLRMQTREHEHVRIARKLGEMIRYTVDCS